MDGDDDRRSLLYSTVITSYPRPRAGRRVTNIPAQPLPRRAIAIAIENAHESYIPPPYITLPPYQLRIGKTEVPPNAHEGWRPRRELLRAGKARLLSIRSLVVIWGNTIQSSKPLGVYGRRPGGGT